MPRPMFLLKEVQLKSLTKKIGKHSDGGNLVLVVKPGNRCSWIFRYHDPNRGRQREKGLGAYPPVTLAQARDEAEKIRRLMQSARNEGRVHDPIAFAEANRAAESAANAKMKSLGECVEPWLAVYSRDVKPDSVEYARNALTTYCKSIWKKRIAEVEERDVLAILEPLWHDKPHAGKKLRQWMDGLMHWAKLKGYRTAENPATHDAVAGHLGAQDLEGIKHPDLPYKQVGDFMTKLRKHDSMSALALEFMVLNATRINESNGARWSEIDLEDKVWTIPGSRMKEDRDFRVPLTDDAVRVLRKMEKLRVEDSEFVFPGPGDLGHISDTATRKLLHQILPDPSPNPEHGGKRYSQHGFRSTFSTWANDCTAHQPLVIEFSLSHGDEDKVREAYRRSDLLEKRRLLMEDWMRFCRTTKPEVRGDKVVSIKKKRA